MITQRLSRNETRFQWVEGATMPKDVLFSPRAENEVTSSFCGSCCTLARYQIRATSEILVKEGKLVNESYCDTKNADGQESDDVEKHL